jgi:hypothetical protein
MTPHSLECIFQRFGGANCFHLQSSSRGVFLDCTEEVGIKLLRSVSTYVRMYTASHPARLNSSSVLLWRHVMSRAALEMWEITRLEPHAKCPTLLRGVNKSGICPQVLVKFQGDLRSVTCGQTAVIPIKTHVKLIFMWHLLRSLRIRGLPFATLTGHYLKVSWQLLHAWNLSAGFWACGRASGVHFYLPDGVGSRLPVKQLFYEEISWLIRTETKNK